MTNSDIESVVLNAELSELMKPLFEEAKLGTIDLGEEEFIEACKDLVRNSSMQQRFTIINQHLSTRKSADYGGHAVGGGKPTINANSNVLSYKDEYANKNVFDRLVRGRETVVKATRLERRMRQDRDSHGDSRQASDRGEELDSGYKLANSQASARHHALGDPVREEDEDDDYS